MLKLKQLQPPLQFTAPLLLVPLLAVSIALLSGLVRVDRIFFGDAAEYGLPFA